MSDVEKEIRAYGHGHVLPRNDGRRTRCGGPGMCMVCSQHQSQMTEATPKPGTSPVCVEVRELGWRLDLLSNGASDIYLASGLGFRFLYGVQKSGPRENPWRAWDVDWEITGETFHPTLEAAQAVCQADFERRVLKLINARSVADVRAERDRELVKLAEEQCFETVVGVRMRRPGEGASCHLARIRDARAAIRFLRSLSEGEG